LQLVKTEDLADHDIKMETGAWFLTGRIDIVEICCLMFGCYCLAMTIMTFSFGAIVKFVWLHIALL
jgi:hypothetical protein